VSTSSFAQSSPSVVSAADVDTADRRSSPANVAVDFESYCDDRQREAMSAAQEDGLEARFSPPQLGQTITHNAVVPSSSSSAASVDNTGSGSVYSLFNVPASDNSNFASKRRTYLKFRGEILGDKPCSRFFVISPPKTFHA